MERVRQKDSSKIHRSAISYHNGTCRRAKTALHVALRTEGQAAYAALVACERAREDAEDAQQQTRADVDGAEGDVENVIRDLDAELGKLDRLDASLNARGKVFPNGYGEVIKPEGEAQLAVLPALRKRMEPVQAQPAIAAVILQLDGAEAALRAALDADKQALAEVQARELAEEAAKQAVREQLESAYGRLRSHYKAKPALAERFFLKNPRGRKKTSAKGKVVTKSG